MSDVDPRAVHPNAWPFLSPGELARLEEMAARLGFTDLHPYDRPAGPLIHARWRGAPVSLSLRDGIAGGFSVAFYRGEHPADEHDADGLGHWHEVAETMDGLPEHALVLGAAYLEEYGAELANRYAGIPLPDPRPTPSSGEAAA